MTQDQKELVRKHQYASIKFNKAEKMPAPAYCTKGKRHYEVHIAKELREDSSKKQILRTLLIHELGHLECRHLDIDYDVELENMRKIEREYVKKNNIPEDKERMFDFSMALNIATDLEVNSKYLTLGDMKFMEDAGFSPITLKNLKVEFKENFREYYEAVIEYLYTIPAAPVIVLDIQGCEGQGKVNGKGMKSNKPGNSSGSGQTSKKDSGGCENESDNKDTDSKGSGNGTENKDDESDKGETDTVSNVVMATDDSEDEPVDQNDHSQGHGQGVGNEKIMITHGKAEAEDEMLKLLLSIKEVTRYKELDSMRLYNRGTRRNSAGILYTSVKRKVKKNQEKLGILIDVSGSMDTDTIRKAMKSVSTIAPGLHRDTLVKTWQYEKSEEFLISEIPERIRTGGGTYLPEGYKEFRKEGFDNIVVYSDFEDTIQDYVKFYDESPCKLYLLVVGNTEDRMKSYQKWDELVLRAAKVIYMMDR